VRGFDGGKLVKGIKLFVVCDKVSVSGLPRLDRGVLSAD
jgi:hypothetical protein